MYFALPIGICNHVSLKTAVLTASLVTYISIIIIIIIFVQSTLRQASIGARWQNRTCQAIYSAYCSPKTSV